jgi:arsenate reductase (glutaredoxin)
VLKIYTYGNCSTCRAAVKWLRQQEYAFEERPIREQPPSVAELERMLAASGGEVKRLCNTSGRDYRELTLGEKLNGLSTSEALGLLHRNGNLVKRPFLLGDGIALVGFDEAAWRAAISSLRR